MTKNQRCKDLPFKEYLLNVRSNSVSDSIPHEEYSFIKYIPIPTNLENIISSSKSLEEFIIEMFPNVSVDPFEENSNQELTSILTPFNSDMRETNDLCLARYQGKSLRTSFSINSARVYGTRDNINVPEENLNVMNPSGFPPHELKLKKFCPLLILKNLNIDAGLCNGTRCILLDKTENVLYVRLLHNNKVAIIPRTYSIDYDTYGYEVVRFQFPVQLAYAMSINKAQV